MTISVKSRRGIILSYKSRRGTISVWRWSLVEGGGDVDPVGFLPKLALRGEGHYPDLVLGAGQQASQVVLGVRALRHGGVSYGSISVLDPVFLDRANSLSFVLRREPGEVDAGGRDPVRLRAEVPGSERHRDSVLLLPLHHPHSWGPVTIPVSCTTQDEQGGHNDRSEMCHGSHG